MDNFYIKIHIGEKKPFYKTKDTEFFKSKSFEEILGGYRYKFPDNEIFKILWQRQLFHSQSLCENIPTRKEIQLTSKRRLALGLGNASVFETSITLHHIYGIPYIPATAVKGILRSWIITEYFSKNGQNLKNAECNALQNLEFCKIFGASEVCDDNKTKTAVSTQMKKDAYMGDIVFFDAFPVNPPTVELDIMNPHYPNYYNNDIDNKEFQPPVDWQNPVPIFFLTVKDTTFQFLFGIRKGRKKFDVDFGNGKRKGDVIKVLTDLLKEALSNHGIGAKTAVGYGRLS